jgi:large subunit ribosomal protein L22
MQFKAKLRFARITPRKLRYVVDLIRGKDYNSAIAILRIVAKRGAYFVRKVLKSAMDNATSIIREKNLDIDVDKLHVVKAWVDQGPMFRRWRPASMGRAVQIRKRTSHLTIVLEEKEPRQSKRERSKQKARK